MWRCWRRPARCRCSCSASSAGILADRFERRRYIIVCQFWMMGVAGVLAGAGLLRPAHRHEPAGAELLHGAGQRHECACLACGRAGDRLRPAASAGDRAQLGRLQPRPHDRPGGRPDPARAGRRVPALRHQHRHLHRRHPRAAGLEAAGRSARCPAPRGLLRGRPRRHRLRPRFGRAQGDLRTRPAASSCRASRWARCCR